MSQKTFKFFPSFAKINVVKINVAKINGFRVSLKKKGLVTTVQPKPEFSRTCGFREVLGINEDCSNAKFRQNP